ncbi:uncharacterized protein [Aegilops tauschii subsp. strangulata]|uniref:Helicase C-terminal domain-containing protein n=2 Tax=Aegilops tauschii subsp. strangulata TaxID=200361 RepID=A0A453TCR9_AEGTS|nr:uncharacterized protein LOC109746070 isoform X2 [Aegilops tauschii subsp. strangulata]
MANTRSGGANNEGAGDASARKGSAIAKSASTSTSSAGGRESRSSSTRETSDEQKPNLRRSNRETRGKNPVGTTTVSSASTPVSQKSTRGRSNPSTPDTPKSSPKKLKGPTMKAGTPRTSDRIKKSTVSASTASNDSNGVPSPVATPDKTVNGQIDEHNSAKHKHDDASESGTRSLKKQKRLTAKSYTSLFKTSSEEYEKSPGYEGNASMVDAEDNGSVLRYEESGAHEEDDKAHLSQVVNNCLEGYTSGQCEPPEVILETDGLKSDVEKSAQCEAPEVILETDGSKTDVEISAPISEAHMTADLCSQNIVAESSPAMDAREPTHDCSEFALHTAMGRKADSSKFVEYWVPACLSRVQLEMYCYTLLSNSPALRSHSKTDSVGALRNILVSLRKCCDHPYLVDAMLQTSLTKGYPVTDILDIGVRASGKLLLLDKMLREIKGKGQRVLILTQSCGGAGNPMGDILDDFVRQRYGFESYERLERGLAVSKKQGAMSMFNDTTKGRFIFLIDSRACLPSIKLSSVDVIIIYCSDWNPTNDLRVLQRISIESQSECVPIFRLYSSCTLEEKALILAKHDHILDSNGQNITPILSHSLLSWGASFQFSRLEELKNDAYLSNDFGAEKLFMDKVLQEYLMKLSTKNDPSTEMSNAAISQARLNGPFYSRDTVVVGERGGISAPDSDLPKFWVNLLDGKSPRWQYITEPAQRSRRKIQNMEEGNIPADEASTKRRKIAGTLDSSANVLAGEDKDSILPEINTTSSRHQISVDHTWQEQGVEHLQDTQKGLHIKLKPELSKLYELFELPGSVQCLCDELLHYTLKNHQVSVEPKHILHAFNIALCWRAASLSRHQVNHRESLALAEKHLKYECSETLAELVYNKLRILKKEFSHRVRGTGENNQSISVKNISPYQQETSTKYGNGKSIPEQAASVGGNESHQEDSHNLVIEAIVPGEKEVKELLSVPEIHAKQHLSKDVLLNRIREKRINLVDMVFSLREKNIHDKQANEVAMFDMHRHKGVVKLREACRIVVEHVRRSQADPEDRGGQTKLIVVWFTMLLCAFLKHMRYQREKLDWQQSKVWTKELQLKEDFLDKAKSGQLDHTFDQSICLPDSGFAIEEFSHFSSCVDTATLANCPQSLHGTSAMEVTLVRGVIPSDVINAEAARNGSAEVFIHSEGRLASEGIGLTENMISNSFDCIDSQGGASLSVQRQLNSSPAIDNSIDQESSSGDNRRTEHVEQQSGVGSQPLPGETDRRLGDAEMEVNTGNGDTTQADPPESQTLAPVPSQASLQMSKEVEAEANLVMLSAEPIVAPAPLLRREAEQVDRSGITPAQTLQAEMQPSASRELSTPTDLTIQSAQPNMVPTVLSQRDVEQSSLLSGVPSSQCLPSVPLSSIPLERTSPYQCQPSHQPEAAPGSSAQLFLGAPMVFNHPPVGDEPLKNELHRLRLYIDSRNKAHKLKQSQLMTECSQEIEKVKQKYNLLLEENDSTHLQQRKALDNLCEKVILNQSLADDFRAKFISSSGAHARAHSPPNHQRPQASQQVPMRPSAAASTASPTASLRAGRPPVQMHHVQPLQVDQPSPSSSSSSSSSSLPSSPNPSVLQSIVRSTSTTSGLAPVLPRGNFGVQSEVTHAPAPHLQHRLPPQVHSMAHANQQQPPIWLESTSARTRSTPVTPVNIRQSCPQAVPPGNPSLSSLHPSSHPTVPAPLGPSSSHQIQQVPLLPSSSQPTRLLPPVSSVPSPVLPLTSPRGKLGLRNDPPGVAARVDVVCLSDDE